MSHNLKDWITKWNFDSSSKELREPMEIPTDWKAIEVEGLNGLILVIGAPGAGKSTFARNLYGQLRAQKRRAAFLDGDPGQSTLGPPTTMTLSMHGDEKGFPPRGTTWRWFVGSTSPAGHMLPLVVGASRLFLKAEEGGVEVVVYDTTGLVGPAKGGDYLKMAKIDLLKPSLVVALQRKDELKSLLVPLCRSHRTEVLELHSPPRARQRSIEERRRHRRGKFRSYFKGADPLTLRWPSFAIFPKPHFEPGRLVALEDVQGFVLGLGIVHSENQAASEVALITPLRSTDDVNVIRIGDVRIDPETYRDQQI
jgi:polynucleotide 5'-hydroxyl-kinase GRC3/NOL9